MPKGMRISPLVVVRFIKTLLFEFDQLLQLNTLVDFLKYNVPMHKTGHTEIDKRKNIQGNNMVDILDHML